MRCLLALQVRHQMNLNASSMICSLAVALLVSCHNEQARSDGPQQKNKNPPQVGGVSTSVNGKDTESSQARIDNESTNGPQPETLNKRLVELRSQSIVPFAEIRADRAKANQQAYALAQLAKMHSQQSARILAELLFMPIETYFYENTVTQEDRGYSYSMMCMDDLAEMLENTPKPLDGRTYRTADIPVWREWWNANKDKLRFKDFSSISKKLSP
jgi:hypothetical protein